MAVGHGRQSPHGNGQEAESPRAEPGADLPFRPLVTYFQQPDPYLLRPSQLGTMCYEPVETSQIQTSATSKQCTTHSTEDITQQRTEGIVCLLPLACGEKM